MREYWLAHPVDRTLTVYRLERGRGDGAGWRNPGRYPAGRGDRLGCAGRASRACGGLSLCEFPVQEFREPTTGQSVLAEKVSHAEGSPVVRPRLNQLTRCAELPWVKLSGVT